MRASHFLIAALVLAGCGSTPKPPDPPRLRAALENESDDIWRSRPDASQQESLMRNEWEWDKHPTFSPDSQRIAFFSNREGYTQIFVMDANGRYPKNISRQPWPEYDPIWVK